MKKNFYTGLFMILPAVITFYIFNWMFNIAFRIINNTIIIKILKKTVFFALGEEANKFIIQFFIYVVAIVIMIFLITLLGYMAKLVFFTKFVKKATEIVERIPIIKTVYSTTKQIIGVVYSNNGETVYKKVVAIEYTKRNVCNRFHNC